MTQEELGAACGTTKQTIFKYENDLITNIPMPRLERIAEILKVSPPYLMGWDTVEADSKNRTNFTPYHPTHRIPILGRISAGLPLYADEHIEGYTYTDLNGGAEYFALRVSGDSMNAARMNDGDLLIVRRQDIVDNGDIAVVLVDDEDATVKRFYKDGNTVTLMPQSTNPEHKPQVYDARKTRIRVQGLVVKCEISYQ